MTDKEIEKRFIYIEAKLYSIMQLIALMTAATIPETLDEAFLDKYSAVLKRMNDDAETRAMMLLNELEARDLGTKDQ